MRRPATALCLVLLTSIASVFGQSAGTIQGVISDNTGAVVPGAQIVITNLETGVRSTSLTNEVGFYTIPALNPGRYTVSCSAQGFAQAERRDMRLEVAQTMRVDFRLTLGSVTEIV